jgi:hypothetical protein
MPQTGTLTTTNPVLVHVPAIRQHAIDLLAWHAKPGDSFEQTLNRLFHGIAPSAAWLRTAELEFDLCRWNAADFADVVKRENFPVRHPRNSDCPLLVVLWKGRAFLIDGHNRLREWLKKPRIPTLEVITIQPRDAG